jgi:hypothetical protein
MAKAPGASAESIAALRAQYPSLPNDSAELMSDATEIEINYRGRYLRLYGPDGCTEFDEVYGITKSISGSVVLGDNGGSEAVLFVPGRGVCRVAYGVLDIEYVTYISDSLTDLLIRAAASPDAVGGPDA